MLRRQFPSKHLHFFSFSDFQATRKFKETLKGSFSVSWDEILVAPEIKPGNTFLQPQLSETFIKLINSNRGVVTNIFVLITVSVLVSKKPERAQSAPCLKEQLAGGFYRNPRFSWRSTISSRAQGQFQHQINK